MSAHGDTAVIVPYDGGRSPLRRGPFERVLAHLAELGLPVIIATDNSTHYSRARAVNRAVAMLGAATLLLNDADLICPHKQILEAIRQAKVVPGAVFAFDTYVRINEPDGEERLLPDAPSNGCVAISRTSFIECGGYDEHFEGWAMEDREFNDRVSLLWPIRRVPGRIEHLWHGERREDDSVVDSSPEIVAANRAYYESLDQ